MVAPDLGRARQAVEADPRCADAWLETARILLDGGRGDEAAAAVRSALAAGADPAVFADDPALRALVPAR